MTIQEALETLEKSAHHQLPPADFATIAEAPGEEVDARLIAVLHHPELRLGYPALHAVELLGKRRCMAAAEPIARVVAEFADADDAISDYGLGALVALGPEAKEVVLAVIEEVGPTGHLEEALVKWGVSDERIYDALVALADDRPGLAAGFLGEYGDARALPLVRRLFGAAEVGENPFFNMAIYDFVEAIEALGGELTPAERAKLDAARASSARFLAQVDILPSSRPHVAGKTPGRNEPCWCGSGKKFKRCHLVVDRDA